MTDVLSPLLCDESWIEARRQFQAVQATLVEQRKREARTRRGEPLAHCRCCHRPIWSTEYATREGGPIGPKCGGRIGHPRTPAAPKAGKRDGDKDPGQLELFVVVRVRG